MGSISNARKLLIVAGLCLIGGVVSIAAPANAVTLVVTPNSTIPSQTTKTVGADWGDIAPYKVNFVCAIPGCANFTSASTTTYQVFRYNEVVATCSNVTYNTKTTVWERAGAGASITGTTVTTWTKGKAC